MGGRGKEGMEGGRWRASGVDVIYRISSPR